MSGSLFMAATTCGSREKSSFLRRMTDSSAGSIPELRCGPAGTGLISSMATRAPGPDRRNQERNVMKRMMGFRQIVTFRQPVEQTGRLVGIGGARREQRPRVRPERCGGQTRGPAIDVRIEDPLAQGRQTSLQRQRILATAQSARLWSWRNYGRVVAFFVSSDGRGSSWEERSGVCVFVASVNV
jgi:hypothetical protein